MAAPEICVAHLVWRPLGLEPFRRFAASFLRHSAGVPCELLLILNGFDEHSYDGRGFAEALGGTPFRTLLLPGKRQDIPAYFEAARAVESEYVCFLNSHSEILCDDWLAKMYGHARREGVGVVGATGSWASHHSINLFHEGEPSAYDELFRGVQERKKRELFGMSEGLKSSLSRKPAALRLLYNLYYRGAVFPFYFAVNSVRHPAERRRLRASFDPFPSPHLRTNAFMLRARLMRELKAGRVRSKTEAYMFEGGKESLTGQVLRRGLKALVVGRDGKAYEPGEWHLSETLWQGEQRNLLVADNQTRDYARGCTRQRTFLSRFAWGDKAAPSPAPEVSPARAANV
ncbi:MAG TPA: glycosyltransferase family A protein [Pyrinomonadaceae bacterium]|nr:glycosyltransferase family A protein [Pyrinomonadaceae bacterium]